MAKYTMKPYVIEAIRFKDGDFEEWAKWLQDAFDNKTVRYVSDMSGRPYAFEVAMIEGNVRGGDGSYVIKGPNGEIRVSCGGPFEKAFRKVAIG